MDSVLQQALIRGTERLAAYADLLNAINVFPVPDGDTGRNLVVSLAPLRQLNRNRDLIVRRLLISARGNSGNIAAAFFSGFLRADSLEMLPQAAKIGRDLAWHAIKDPKPGAMLTVFDALAETLNSRPMDDKATVSAIIAHLKDSVRSTSGILPELRDAKVVDAGALGMFIYLETFFQHLAGADAHFMPITDSFGGMLQVAPNFPALDEETSYCVNMTVRLENQNDPWIQKVSEYGSHAVISVHEDCLKIHLHTDHTDRLRKEAESAGVIVYWADDRIESLTQTVSLQDSSSALRPYAIMTDAAGSVTRRDAEQWGMILLDSYISIGDSCMPETLLTPAELYEPMKQGVKVSTSQASIFERHQHWHRVLERFHKVLYLCVGSVFTGNYQAVIDWKQQHDPTDRVTVIDTHAASGKLGIIALATARYASKTTDFGAVVEFARQAAAHSQEFIFLDKLKYLAAGGRLSKTSALMGDLLNMKPIISPTSEGAKKVGMVRTLNEQVGFALEQLNRLCQKGSKSLIMLEYTDNRSWVEDSVYQQIKDRHSEAEIILQPLSLTSGVHTGPGTWAVAIHPSG